MVVDGKWGESNGRQLQKQQQQRATSSRKKARRWKSGRLDHEGGDRRVSVRVTGAAHAATAKAEINDVESSSVRWNKERNAVAAAAAAAAAAIFSCADAVRRDRDVFVTGTLRRSVNIHQYWQPGSLSAIDRHRTNKDSFAVPVQSTCRSTQ